jgi:hypothetical protein
MALSARWGEHFRVLAAPDELERQLPAVDLLIEGNDGRHVVVEHTIVESFSGRIRDDVLISELARIVEPALASKLPAKGHFRLVLRPDGLSRRADLEEIATALAKWAAATARELEVGNPHSAPRHFATDVLAPWGLNVRLERWPGRDGQVSVFRSVPQDLEELRRQRVREARAAKCPKLAAARLAVAESILVLESNDLALGNYVDIASAVVAELKERDDRPDVVCLIETEIQPDVWLIKERAGIFPDLSDPGPLEGSAPAP